LVNGMAGKTNIICAIGGHAPRPEPTRNRGIEFTRCRRCGADLVRKRGAWQAVPKGYRVVWRSRRGVEADAGGRPAATVLVCDDDPLILELLRHRLAERGYRVELAGDGAEGLARVAERRPDAIILDAMMPRIDGFEVLRTLRENGETRHIPVIFLTARRQERDVLEALSLGADDFINKPFIPEELLSRLSRLLAARRLQRQPN
jgi:CheY-like chemotaxis protein